MKKNPKLELTGDFMELRQKLLSRIAELESINDQLETELSYVDALMKKVGFSEGLLTVKETAEELAENPEEYGI